MPLIPVQLPAGIVRQNTPYDTVGAWWDMNQVRWQAGTIKPIGGWDRLTGTPLDSAVRRIYPYRDNSNNLHTLVGTDAKLYADNGGYTDITPSGLAPLTNIGALGGYGTFNYGQSTYGTARPAPSPVYSPYAYWTMDNWGEDAIITNNADGRLFYYTSSTPTTAPTVISTAPTNCNSVVVTDERHVLVCGLASTAVTSERAVAWSSQEDYTDWNFASTTNTAGFQQLNVRSPLLKAVKVKEGVLIFSYSECFLGQYVGQPFVYGFTRLSDTAMMHPNSIVPFNGKAIWLSRTGFQMYAGGFVQPLACPILDAIFAEMDSSYGGFRLHGAHNAAFSEVTFFYATTGNKEANRYVTYNYAENWWSWGFMARSAMAPAEVYKYPLMGGDDGNMYRHESGNLAAGVSRVGQIYVESGALGIGNGDQFVEVRQVLPATGTGINGLSVTFFSSNTPEGNEAIFGPYYPRADGYVDVRVTGRESRIRFESADDSTWSIGKVRLDVAAGSGR